MTKLRAERGGGGQVDYTDFLSPAAKGLPSRSKKPTKKRKAHADDDDDEENNDHSDKYSDEEELLVKNKKKTKMTATKPTKAATAAKTARGGGANGKPKAASKRNAKDERTSSSDSDMDDAPTTTTNTKKAPKSKAKADTNKTATKKPSPMMAVVAAAVAPKTAAPKRSVVEPTSSSSSSSSSSTTNSNSHQTTKPKAISHASLGGGGVELETLRKKYEALREFRELETGRLLKEAKELAKEEKKTYEKLVGKLKSEVATLSSRAQQTEIDHKKKITELQTEQKLRIESVKRDCDDTVERLRRQLQSLQAEIATAMGAAEGGRAAAAREDVSVAAAARAGNAVVELSQAKKLLELYRLVTSTEIRLIEAATDEDDDNDAWTDVACAVIDSVTGTRFVFDLAVPHNAKEEVEYVPSEPTRQQKQQRDDDDSGAPSYLHEELSFQRSELTNFMKTLLDVVSRSHRKTPGNSQKR